MADATLSQGRQIIDLSLKEENSREFLQNLIERWGAVQLLGRGEATQAMLVEALKHINLYANEKVEPKFFYPEGYKPKTVEEQVRILLARLDWLDTSHVSEIAATWPECEQADGLYAVPKPSSVAAHIGVEDPWTNFGQLIEQGPIAAIASAWQESGRKFTNYRAGTMGSEYYRLSEQSKRAIQTLEADQPGDLLVFPAQTGRLYAGHSVRNSRAVIQHAENPGQWPLTGYVVGWQLFANPHRLTRFEDLAIDLPGDEYSWYADGQFDDALYFDFYDEKLCLNYGFFGHTSERFGSASGFSRQ